MLSSVGSSSFSHILHETRHETRIIPSLDRSQPNVQLIQSQSVELRVDQQQATLDLPIAPFQVVRENAESRNLIRNVIAKIHQLRNEQLPEGALVSYINSSFPDQEPLNFDRLYQVLSDHFDAFQRTNRELAHQISFCQRYKGVLYKLFVANLRIEN